MELRDPPSLFNKVVGPPFFLIGGFAAIVWFFYRAVFFIHNITEQSIVFDKGSYYMLGVGVGLISLGLVTAIEFWGGKPITNKQSAIFSKLILAGLVLLLVVPHFTHFAVGNYLERKGYSICEVASHQWLFVRDVVYIQPSVECSVELGK